MFTFKQADDLLTRDLRRLRTRLVTYGKLLVHRSAEDRTFPLIVPRMVYDLAAAHGFPEDMRQDAVTYTQALASGREFAFRENIKPVLLTYAAEWHRAFVTGDQSKLRNAIYLQAVKQVLTALASVSWGFSKGGSKGASGSAGAGGSGSAGVSGGRAPGAQGVQPVGGASAPVSAGVSLSNNASNAESFSASVNLILLPLVDLVDRLIAAEFATSGLSADEAVSLWRARAIGEAHARAIVGLTNTDWTQATLASWLRRESLSAAQVVELARRVGLGNDDLTARLAQVGLWSDDDRDGSLTLYDRVPAYPEAMALDVRGVLDEGLAVKRGLDNGFVAWWNSSLGQAAFSQGISAEWAQRQWRAHWSTTGAGEAAVWVQRLRPGSVPEEAWYTLEDFKVDLRLSGATDYQINRAVRVVFRPLPFRQIQRLRDTGLLTELDAEGSFQDAGFSHENAVKLAKQTTIQRSRDLAAQGHGLTVAEIVNLVEGFLMTKDEAVKAYSDLGYDQDTALAGVKAAEYRRGLGIQKRNIEAIHHAYVTGAYNPAEAIAALVKSSFDGGRAQLTVEAWTVEKDARRHVATLGELATWYKDGLIGTAGYLVRLMNLGYSYPDAVRLIRQTQIRMAEAAHAEALRELHQVATAALAHARQVSAAAKLLAAQRAHAQRVKVEVVTAEQHEAFRVQEAALKKAVADHLAELKKNPTPGHIAADLAERIAVGSAQEGLLEALEKATQVIPVPVVAPPKRQRQPKTGVK